ncbi:MAG TPA: bifunctional protein-serine/threonine kinase/phosphatase [Burkholderiales bacterium]|nr:bifunctional protein-serine/threonine kinase/phosphatase [Burkholderiales bacterium]
MSRLAISSGQYSDKGRKDRNQDFHGILVPPELQLGTKGIAVALADGISSSDVSEHASKAAVTGFLEDYFCTSDTWTVKTSGQRVLHAINSWLHAQTQQSQHRYDMDKGYVCAFSALVLKSATAHLFHIGDTRIYRLRNGGPRGGALEQLTEDHRLWVSREQSYLGRALGMKQQAEIDYLAVPVEAGDIFLLTTDGVHEHVDAAFIAGALAGGTDLGAAATRIAAEAHARGSPDNLTVQVVRVDGLPDRVASEFYQELSQLPFPPELRPRMEFDGYTIVRELHASDRSRAYLAVDQGGERVVIKSPSTEGRGDPAYLERFLLEEWVARRVNSAHVLKASAQTRKRNYFYVVTEFIEGQTLAQWMVDHPKPDLRAVRGIIDQVAKGLQALHRLEMVHQDIRPANIMIDAAGTAKIIDFGSTRVAGIVETALSGAHDGILGTEQYSAPEYFLGEAGTASSDLFSLGVIAYQMLTGRLPYGTQVSKSRTRAAQRRLKYRSTCDDDRDIPAWVDEAIRKAVQPDPFKRYRELSEFVFDLHHPNREFLSRNRAPLIERNPVAFWKSVSLVLAITVLVLVGSHIAGRQPGAAAAHLQSPR